MSEHEGVLELRLAEDEEVAASVTAALLSLGWPTAAVRAAGRYCRIRLADGTSSGAVTLADDDGGLLLSLDGRWDARRSEPLFLTATALASLGGQPAMRGGAVVGLVADDITVQLTRTTPFASATASSIPRAAVLPPVQAKPAAAPAPARATPAPSPPQPVRPVAPVATRPAPAAPASGLDWGAVTAYSAKVQEEIENSSDVDLDELRRGDVLLHPALGRCRFHEAIGEDSAKVLLPNQSMRKLMMRVFRIVPAGPDRTYNLIKKD